MERRAEGRRERGEREVRHKEAEGDRKMTAGSYQHGEDIFLVFLLEEDEDV